MSPLRLAPGHEDDEPVRLLQETLEYTTSPENYLIQRLGQDVVTQRSSLLSIPTELIDRDGYGRGVHKQHFEQHIATLLGKTKGTYFITGIQAQLAAMKIWCDRANNQRVAWHCRSHPETAESNAYAEVFQLQRSFIGTSPVHVPTVADIQVVTRRPADERPAVILLELPNRHLGCQTYPYDDLVQISRLCRAANIRLHLDGARLWEIQPFYNRPFADLARLFDSVYVSLYKGLRGTVGCVLASSDAAFMAEAALWQRRLGGWMVTSYPVLIDCERAFNLNIGTFERKWRKMCAVAAAIVQATKDFTTSDGRPIVYFTPEVPTCCQVHTHIRGVTRERLAAARDEVERDLGLSVFPWTLPSPFMHELDPDWVLVNGDPLAVQGMDQYFEWSITDKNVDIPDAVFAQGWRAIVTVLFA